MSLHPTGCLHCAELEAELRRAKALLGQLLTQTRIAMANQRVAEKALLDYLEPPPGEELRAV